MRGRAPPSPLKNRRIQNDFYKKHFNEYKETFASNSTKIYDNLEDAAVEFSEKVNVSKEVAKDRIENNSNADWIVAPNGKVYMFFDFSIIKQGK